MTAFDYIVLTIVVLSAALGLWRGVIREVFSLAAWIAAIVCMFLFGELVATWLPASMAKTTPWFRELAGYVLVFIGVFVALSVVGFLFTKLVQAVGLSFIDRALGMMFGAVRGLLVVVLLVLLAGATDVPQRDWWRDSLTAKPLETLAMAVRTRLPENLGNVFKGSA